MIQSFFASLSCALYWITFRLIGDSDNPVNTGNRINKRRISKEEFDSVMREVFSCLPKKPKSARANQEEEISQSELIEVLYRCFDLQQFKFLLEGIEGK
jgi:hypothetical protein